MEDVNYGLEYRFLTPEHRRHGRKRHHGSHAHAQWRLRLRGECSVTCGGGSRELEAVCEGGEHNRCGCRQTDGGLMMCRGASNDLIIVRCDPDTRPPAQHVPCNPQPCPATWVTGPWGTCSVTCGPGLQTRSLTCRQHVSGTGDSEPVSPSLCPSDHSHVTSRECSLGTCPNVTRDPGYPAYVSPPGLGRAVTSLAERIFPYSMAPSSASRHQAASRAVYQVSGSEAGDNTSVVIVTPDWVTQAWGACSVSCGQGVKERQVRWFLSFHF